MPVLIQSVYEFWLTRAPLVGHYLNLPVVEEDGRLVAIVDVLKLTYATLEQVCCNPYYWALLYSPISLLDEPYDGRGNWRNSSGR